MSARMEFRKFIPALAAFVIIAVMAAWVLTSPTPKVIPTKPNEPVPAPNEAETRGPLTADIEAPQPEPSEPPPLDKPPPPPEVVNDLSSGSIWLRLIDDDTNRPVVGADCRFVRFDFVDGKAGLGKQVSKPTRRTDSDGLIWLSIGSKADADIVLETGTTTSTRMHLPVPEGHHLWFHPSIVQRELPYMVGSPLSSPIDVLVRRSADVKITCRDSWGAGISEAQLFMTLIAPDWRAQDWLESVNELVFEESIYDWEERASELEDLLLQQMVRVDFDNVVPEDEPLPSAELRVLTDAGGTLGKGNFTLTGLPQLQVGVIAWHPVWGLGVASKSLNAGRNELDVYLRKTSTCGVNLRVERLGGETDEAGEELSVEILPAGSSGASGLVDLTAHERIAPSFQLAPSEVGVWQGRVTGLMPGRWLIRAESWGLDVAAGQTIVLDANEVEDVTLYIGEDAWARWAPAFHLNGEFVDGLEIEIQGGFEPDSEIYRIWVDEETGRADFIDLAAGIYEIRVPGMEPFTTSLRPRESRRNSYNIDILQVRFSIGKALCRLMEGEDGVVLNLYGSTSGTTQSLLEHLDYAVRETSDDYDVLKPGVARTWPVPPGEYYWELSSNERDLNGRIDFTDDGPLEIHFDVGSLPELMLFDLTLKDFDPDGWYVEFHEYAPRESAINALGGGPLHWAGASVVFDVYDPLDVEIQSWEFRDQGRVVAFAPIGTYSVIVADDSKDVERTIVASFPGRRTVTVGRLLSEPDGVHLYNTSYVDEGWESLVDGGLSLVHVSGRVLETNRGKLPPGEVRIESWRDSAGPGRLPLWATKKIMLEDTSVDLELDQLSYVNYGVVDLVFRGRGSPEKSYDAWWDNLDWVQSPYMIAEDYPIGRNLRIVNLAGHARPSSDQALEFRYPNQQLPPGRYTVVPWHGAPEKYRKTFTVRSGSRQTVVIDTGK